MDTDVARRAAAAEARRQKILARGAERLSRITVGTPLLADAANSTDRLEIVAPSVATATSGTPVDATPSAQPFTRPSNESGTPPAGFIITANTLANDASGEALAAAHGDAAAADEASVPADVLASADPMLQEVLRAGSGGQLPGQDPASLQAAQRDAEQALHALLNQLAENLGPGGATYLSAQQQLHRPSNGGGTGSSGRTPGGVGDDSGGGGGSGRAAADLVPVSGSGRHSPGAARPSPAGRRGGDSGSSGVTVGDSAISRVLLALAAAIAAVTGLLLGPQLTAAVEATRLLRCAAALALAAALYGGLMEPAHLGLPPVLALLLVQAALIAAARALGGPSAGGRPSLGLGKSPLRADLANGSGDGDADAPAAAGGVAGGATPPPHFDWATLVPGLRPLLDKLSSAGALVSGLFGDVAVFIVSYLVLDAWGQVAGRRVALSGAP